MRHKRAFFALEDDAIGLQGLQIVPYVLGDIYAVDAILCAKHHRLYHRAVIIIGCRAHFASQDNERLILRRMPMDGHLRAWLYSI